MYKYKPQSIKVKVCPLEYQRLQVTYWMLNKSKSKLKQIYFECHWFRTYFYVLSESWSWEVI